MHFVGGPVIFPGNALALVIERFQFFPGGQPPVAEPRKLFFIHSLDEILGHFPIHPFFFFLVGILLLPHQPGGMVRDGSVLVVGKSSVVGRGQVGVGIGQRQDLAVKNFILRVPGVPALRGGGSREPHHPTAHQKSPFPNPPSFPLTLKTHPILPILSDLEVEFLSAMAPGWTTGKKAPQSSWGAQSGSQDKQRPAGFLNWPGSRPMTPHLATKFRSESNF